MTSSRLSRILRPAISLVLLGYILSLLDRQQLIALWPQIQPRYLLAALALGLAMMLLSAFKWQLLLKGHGTCVSLITLFRYYLVGTFFNMFLPTSVGGDVRRVYDLTQGHASAELATASVLLDRATGVLAMLIIGSVSVLLVPLQWRGAALLILAGTATAVLLLGGAIFFTQMQGLLVRLTNLLLPSALRRRALAFLDTLSHYRNEKRLLGVATGIGLVFQSISVFIVFLLSKALGLHVSLLPFFLFVPVITLATMLPISLNGLGVQDTGYVILFAQVGLPAPVAFSLSLLFHLYRATIGALGGLVYASGRRDSGDDATAGNAAWVWPLAVGAAGILLRGYYLWTASPFVDEPSTLLVAEAILRHGLPILPSGIFYGHDLPFSYLAALFVALFGPHAESVRWLSLLASAGTLTLLYAWGRKRFSPAVGLWAMAIWAVLPDAVLWGARGRSYALLQFLLLAACIAFVEGVLVADRPRLRRAAWLLLLLAIFTHAEAAMAFAPWLAAALWVKGKRWFMRPAMALETALVAAGIGIRFALQRFIALGQGTFGTLAGSRPAIVPLAHVVDGLKTVLPFFSAPDRIVLSLLVVVLVIPANWSRLARPLRAAATLPALMLAFVPAQMILLVGSTWQSPRYLIQLLPLFAVLAALGIDVIAGQIGPRVPRGATVIIALVILLTGSWQAWAVIRAPEIGYRQSFAYVAENAGPGDRIVTTAPAASMTEIGRVDRFAMSVGYEEFVLRRDDGQWVDRWLGVPLIRSASEMAALLDQPGTTWFVTDSTRLYTHYDPAFVQLVWNRMGLADSNQRSLVFRSRPAQSYAVSRARSDRFENGLTLRGYRLGTPEQRGDGTWGELVVGPQEALPVELLWQRTGDVADTPQLFLHLVGEDGRFYSQVDVAVLQGRHPPSNWAADIRYPDHITWNLPLDLPPGRYRIDAGLYRPSDGKVWAAQNADHVVLDYVVVPPAAVANPIPRLAEPPVFGDTIRLLGVEPLPGERTAQRGTELSLTFLWQCAHRPARDYTLFVHLLDDSGRVRAQYDGQPLSGFYPTSQWDTGEQIRESVSLVLADEISTGHYTAQAGWYRPDTGRRLLLASGEDVLTLAEITIVP